MGRGHFIAQRSVRYVRLVALGLVAITSCGGERSPPEAPLRSQEVHEVPHRSPVVPSNEVTEKIGYIVTSAGVEKVGDPDHSLFLGAQLPRAMLAGIAEKYVCKYVADVQPFDGFQFDDPPATVKLVDGPFARAESKSSFVEHGPPQPGTKAHKALAASAAKMAEKMLVTWIEVSSGIPHTKKGAHVGSTPEEIQQLHPEAAPFFSPGYYSDGDCGFEIDQKIIFFQETPNGACDKHAAVAHIWIK